ncbi:hypothetical protein F383_17595 [Gossypium arboreum]|uniref:Uncharacterized protein n=1 Tax=Gossypium arboreum TaxID=29729 RepID=A0A0B0MJT3_GOSAR|nr:hypothetical protein F383_17595 [Gossypium arboreum]
MGRKWKIGKIYFLMIVIVGLPYGDGSISFRSKPRWNLFSLSEFEQGFLTLCSEYISPQDI